jgi:hypothetical protein
MYRAPDSRSPILMSPMVMARRIDVMQLRLQPSKSFPKDAIPTVN